ncbi:uncharacterized protein LOC114937031 [Nylanderia fulva]|uniref:uncharacterized protein LOC114937031 n=1 Tax=Nylanderia fulva TaxID=613905 RepID=UPI0010FADEEF|nr:uncharacterized protein LOC114937031 [Nylanderia fulva]
MEPPEIQMVNTCEVCEIIVDENEILQHPCLENYNRVHIDNNRYFYPVCDNGTIIRHSDIGNNTEAIVEDIINVENEPSTSSLSTQETEDIEELLIEEVSRREILYNYNIPITQRNRLAINEQWQQVSTMLNGRLSAKEAQKKWKIL